MPWIKKEYDCGGVVVVVKCFASRYGTKGQMLHICKGNATTEKQQRVNDRKAMQRYSILANANFKQGDYYITFTFKRGKLPESTESIKAIWKSYRRKLRTLYKKNGKELKYLYVIECEGVRPHIHILFNNEVNAKDLPIWQYGAAHIEILDDREYHTIGEYFVKCRGDNEIKKGIIGSSRNLYRPQPKITRLQSPTWSETPTAKSGYKIINDTVINGYAKTVSQGYIFVYQYYIMAKIE